MQARGRGSGGTAEGVDGCGLSGMDDRLFWEAVKRALGALVAAIDQYKLGKTETKQKREAE